MGTSVISGTGKAIVVKTGKQTEFGHFCGQCLPTATRARFVSVFPGPSRRADAAGATGDRQRELGAWGEANGEKQVIVKRLPAFSQTLAA